MNEPCIDLNKQQILFPELLFAIDKAELRPQSFGTLEKLAPLILRHPELGPLEVRGHRAYHPSLDLKSRDLTELRAKSVKQFLVEKGVTPERLSAHGYQATMPIVQPATSLKNRRIEIVILQPPARPSPR
jgi:outer membrane protein OmpA-like peptidoglycan-associated protein